MSFRPGWLAASVLGTALSISPAAKSQVVDIPYETFTLDNGLRVVVHEDHKAPIVAVNVWYHVGSKDEKPGKTGFAHLFEHLMFQGSENFKDEYFKPFEKAGATGQNGTTWLDRTNYFENVPTTALDMALWMESDRMAGLPDVLTQAKLDNQRDVVKNEVPAANSETLNFVAADQARDAGLKVQRGKFPYDEWLEAIAEQLGRHRDEDEQLRAEVSEAFSEKLSERELLYGARQPLVSLPGTKPGWVNTDER